MAITMDIGQVAPRFSGAPLAMPAQELRSIQEEKSKPHKTTHHTAEEWERHLTTIELLYIFENRTLKDVIKIMETCFNFKASERQYRHRLEKWKFCKNESARPVRQFSQDSSNSQPNYQTILPFSCPPIDDLECSTLQLSEGCGSSTPSLMHQEGTRFDPNRELGYGMPVAPYSLQHEDLYRRQNPTVNTLDATATRSEEGLPTRPKFFTPVALRVLISASTTAAQAHTFNMCEIANIREYADLLSALDIFQDAFKLYLIISQQFSLQTQQNKAMNTLVAIGMAQCATTPAEIHYLRLLQGKNFAFLDASTIEMCQLQSLIGRYCIRQQDMASASAHCHQAMRTLRVFHGSANTSGQYIPILTNLTAILRDLGEYEDSEGYELQYSAHVRDITCPYAETIMQEILEWCEMKLSSSSSFALMCQKINPDIWNAPAFHISASEIRLLTLFLWGCFFDNLKEGHHSRINPEGWEQLRRFEATCGVKPVATLKTIAYMLIPGYGPHRQSELPYRAQTGAGYLRTKYSLRTGALLFPEFLLKYKQTCEDKPTTYPTLEYKKLIDTTIFDLIDSRTQLYLSETQNHRLNIPISCLPLHNGQPMTPNYLESMCRPDFTALSDQSRHCTRQYHGDGLPSSSLSMATRTTSNEDFDINFE